MGLIDRELESQIGRAYGVTLTEQQLTNFTHTTRQPLSVVKAMLLDHYHGVAAHLSDLDPDDRASVKKVSVREWIYFSGSHICPRCIEEDKGAWQLAWKLPWSFACVRHKLLLVDTCPGCDRRPGTGRQDGATRPRFVSRVPLLTHCMNAKADGAASAGLSSTPCGHPLNTVPARCLDDFPKLLGLQSSINAVLETARTKVAGRDVSALEFFTDLRSLCALILYAAKGADLNNLPTFAQLGFAHHEAARAARIETRKELGNGRYGPHTRVFTAAPKSAALMAALLPAVLHIVQGHTPEDVAGRMHWLVERGLERKKNRVRQLPRYLNFSPRLLEPFERCLEPRRNFVQRFERGADNKVEKDDKRFHADHVPQLLWLEAYQSGFKDLLPNIRQDYGRRVCSMALVKLSGKYTWLEAAEALELPPKQAVDMANKVVGVLEAEGHSDLFAERMCGLARELASNPERIDYAERRQVLSSFTEIDWEDWRTICNRAGMHVGKRGERNRYAAVWLWCYLTEGDYRLSPGLRARAFPKERDVYRRLLKASLLQLEDGLRRYGSTLLHLADAC